MKDSIRKGLYFGLTSSIITTLGLIVGLRSGTGSEKVVLGGIITIAVADALSDALGIHISEESDKKNSPRHIWESTLSTFMAKFFFALTFIIPFLFLELFAATVACIIYGIGLLTMLSYNIAAERKIKPYGVIFEHLMIAVAVIIITHYLGVLIAAF